jgi:branched-chain amino acid transport system permease protein
VSAAEIGAFFSLVALAYHIVGLGSGFLNFAVGGYAMVAAAGTSWLAVNNHVEPHLAAVLMLVGAGALAAGTEVGLVRPIQRRTGHNELPLLVALVALVFVLQQVAGLVVGQQTSRGQSLWVRTPFRLGSTIVRANTILLVLLSAGIFVVVAAWLRTTVHGRLIRAVGDNPSAASLLGFPVLRTRLLAFALSGVVAGSAGILFAPKAGVGPQSGVEWALYGFLAFVIGGTGSLWGPLVGGLVIGGAQVFLPFYFGGPAVSYILLVVGLVFFGLRPQGLFTRRVRT